MEVLVSFYGNLTRLAGGRTRAVVVGGATPTVADLRVALAREIPGIAPQLARTAVGMDGELVRDDTRLHPGREVSLLPPVSGGVPPRPAEAGAAAGAPRLQEGPLSLDALLDETSGVDAGALVVFAGTVRAEDAGEDIAALEYDVHREMAEKAIRTIEEEIAARPGILACRIVHRVGIVSPGEPSVYVVVRGRHRPEAFEAARAGIDRVKAEAPIWKEDIHPDGRRTAHTGADATPLVSSPRATSPGRGRGRPESGGSKGG